jgi:hypothetical protein
MAVRAGAAPKCCPQDVTASDIAGYKAAHLDLTASRNMSG